MVTLKYPILANPHIISISTDIRGWHCMYVYIYIYVCAIYNIDRYHLLERYMCIYTYIDIDIYIYIFTYKYTSIYIFIYMYIYMYIYISIYTYIYIYIYIHIYNIIYIYVCHLYSQLSFYTICIPATSTICAYFPSIRLIPRHHPTIWGPEPSPRARWIDPSSPPGSPGESDGNSLIN